MKILITESSGFSRSVVVLLRERGHTVSLRQCDYKSLKKAISRYDCIIVRLGVNIDKDLLKCASRLKYVVTMTTGVDHIDEEYCRDADIQIISLQGDRSFLRTVTSTAELTFALMLNVYRHVVPAVLAVRASEWNRDAYIGKEVQGKIVGVVGLGRLGLMVARYSKAFGADVIYYDPYVRSKRYTRCASLRQLAQKADIVTLHVPLDNKTRNMIDWSFFQSCKSDAILINTSRKLNL